MLKVKGYESINLETKEEQNEKGSQQFVLSVGEREIS